MVKSRSKAYWVRREHMHADQIKASAKVTLDKLLIAYRRTQRDIQDDINRNYVRYAKDNQYSMAKAMELADKMDVQRFAEKAADYVHTKDFSKTTNADLKLYNLKMRVSRLKLLQMEIELEVDRLRGKVTNTTEEHLRKQAMAEYRRQAGILGKSLYFDSNSVNRLVNASYKLAGTGNLVFSDSIWNNMELLKSNLKKILNKALLQGKNPNQFNKDLHNIFGAQPYQAGRILITETARIQGDVQLDCYGQAGINYYDIVYERKACDECIEAAKAGPYRYDKAEIGVNMYPFHPNCLCSIMPVDPEDNRLQKYD